MNSDWLIRTETLIGAQKMDKLQRATVAILGLGGVGGAAAEAICRMGVGRIILVDSDTVDRSNLNRQLFATADMVGQSKCLAARRRLLSINPEVELSCLEQFFLPDRLDDITIVHLPDIFRNIALRGFGGHHDDRDVLYPAVLVHYLQHIEAVHLGHDVVEQHERDTRALLLQRRHGLLAVLSLDDAVS